MPDFGKRFVIAGGGTGGHLFPALAIGEGLKKRFPGSTIHFIGSKYGLESNILPTQQNGFTLLPIRGFLRGFNVKSSLRNILFPTRFILSYLKSKKILKKIDPSVVIGTGGYASGLPLIAAISDGIPTLIHEQNSFPGITTKWLSSRVDRVCISYEDSRRHLRNRGGVVTGNPVRKEIIGRNKLQSLQKFGLTNNKPTISILGGSQGSKILNESIDNIIKHLSEFQIIWQTGNIHFDQYNHYSKENIKVVPFIEDMGAFYSSSDLIISRAGALALAEIAACKKPSILIPFAKATDNHQSMNAESLRVAGAAKVLSERDLSSKLLLQEIISLIKNKTLLKKMSTAAKSVSKIEAIDLIIDEIEFISES
tara:strand:- start:12374 stop:13474 length:1101 start_codon:yes stop_codon:yes gene_type:complete